MTRAMLERIEQTDQGTVGKLYVDTLKFFTGELPWRDNEAGLSCIPTGIYECEYNWSAKHKAFSYEVKDVVNRTGIRLHAANLFGDTAKGYKSQVEGCIAIGLRAGFLDGQRAIHLSQRALRELEDYLAGEEFLLEII
jgi:hypothetical protein